MDGRVYGLVNEYGTRLFIQPAFLIIIRIWCSTYVTKDGGSQKRKPVQAEVDIQAEVGEPEERPVGVKAAKGVTKKKKSGREEELSQLQDVLEVKEKLARHKLLDRLFGTKEPLSAMETSLKLKLMSEML
ncbi:hypothetical protein Bca4012_001520 [Brassica carinata]|uniref:Uncharacterized protein n=1 Tax=Brassica carinata TaxID=52824 RepID=A0A8X7UYK8_BRACI|nr:hypothetical protein Bca52824_043714 [Brassica carinata]